MRLDGCRWRKSIVAARTAAAVQQVQTLIKFDESVFGADNTASWLTWSQKVAYQANTCGFEAELTAAEGGGRSDGAGVFYRSDVDPVILRNAHAAWMTLINNCRGMIPEIVQRSKAPNDDWHNLISHYRANGTRDTLLAARG